MIGFNGDSVKDLTAHYKENGGITLIGLNDSQLIDVKFPYSEGSFDLLTDIFRNNIF